MMIGCPECHGRRKMYYRVQDEPDRPLNTLGVLPTDVTVESREEPCRTCKGDGRVEESTLGPEFRVKVYQRLSANGELLLIGTVPPSFEPSRIRSTNWLYTPRPGDFTRENDYWVANYTLGSGDLEAVPGFVWDRSHYERG
jgi:hypothetical protein